MGEDNILFGPGTLYANERIFGEVKDLTVKEPEYVEDRPMMFSFARACDSMNVSCKMATDAFTRFVHVISGIDRHLKDTCPNRRVVHLAYRAKKSRVRKKNYNRMIRICEKGEK